MKKWRVGYAVSGTAWIVVEAVDKDEADLMAQEIEIQHFQYDLDWVEGDEDADIEEEDVHAEVGEVAKAVRESWNKRTD